VIFFVERVAAHAAPQFSERVLVSADGDAVGDDLRASLEAFWILRLICVGSALGQDRIRNALDPLSLVRLEVSGNSERTPDDIRNALNETRDAGRHVALVRVKSGQIVRYVAVPVDPASPNSGHAPICGPNQPRVTTLQMSW